MSVYIIAIIIALVTALACYAFISHAIERRRIQKQRLLMALKTKQRNFEYMVDGFPQNFLPPDLLGVALRELINLCEQLAEIDKDDPKHLHKVANYSAQLSGLPKPNMWQRLKLENPTQIKEVLQHLVELQRFIVQQATIKQITRAQMDTHIEQIKNLSLQMSVDTYLIHAKEAQVNGKLRLAIHYFTLARKLFLSENEGHHYDKQIAQLDNVILKMEEKAQEQGLIKPVDKEAAPAPEISKEWEQVKSTKDESWKKKNVYD